MSSWLPAVIITGDFRQITKVVTIDLNAIILFFVAAYSTYMCCKCQYTLNLEFTTEELLVPFTPGKTTLTDLISLQDYCLVRNEMHI